MHAQFDTFQYKRPDLSVISQHFDRQLNAFHNAENVEQQYNVLETLIQLREEFSTMFNLCHIRHTSNIGDDFYTSENDYFDQSLPVYEELSNKMFKVMLDSKFRQALEQKTGKQLFTLAELSIKTFNPSILELLGEENALSSAYTKIKSNVAIEFEGNTYNLTGLYPLELSSDRTVRQKASQAKWSFYAQKQAEVEAVFDQMVKKRHQIALQLGYKNFVEVGYARMRRSDYNPEMVANFRKQVRELIVPLAAKLYDRQRKRLKLDQLNWYDEDFKFVTGNPKPVGNPEQIISNAARMYQELSPDTDTFFKFMQESKLMDLVNRAGKAPGGYCTYLVNFKAPFIFSNFNGTSGDIDVLTHEAGHAFQVWSSGQRFQMEEYHWPTSDAAEIHSMSMEFFTWPWMKLFFGDQTDKYYFLHLAGSLQFIPYGVAVDEFQHIIYENPEMTPAERNAVWRDLERVYLPHRSYPGNDFLESGGFWQKQSHIFNHPFYYIDYTLAQICAFQFWSRDRKNHEDAWKDYVELCRAGGSKSFVDLVKLANLRSPFEDGCVASVIDEIASFLDSVDDSSF
jgi:M3 family oligoendopeptidase